VAGLADAGVDTVFISPGSRNTPLTLAFAADPRVRDISIRDERSAGFAALGYGKATGRPAAVVCTSGSAATHYFPAVVEADQAGSPLIVLTADRPARLRGTGAPQTMNQIDLYGSHVKWFIDLDTTDPSGRDEARLIATTASALPAGPVHANVAFDEPLIPDLLPIPRDPQGWIAYDDAGPQEGTALDPLVGRNVLIVASGRQQAEFCAAVNLVAEALGAPVMSDPQCWVTGPNTIANGDLLAGCTDAFDVAPPDVVLRLGPIPISKPLWTWLERSGVEQILVDRSRLTDPLRSAATVHDADPTAHLHANAPDATSDRAFLGTWLDLDEAVHGVATRTIAELPFPNEPEIARTLAACVPTESFLYVASSMPIRDIDTFAEPRSDITVLANRGVNGIDGTISSALGAALSGAPVTLLVGDIAALHDTTAMSEVARTGAPLRIVVINNDGGGIFSFLPQARSDAVDAQTFERHWGTPHGLSLQRIAESMGLGATRIDTIDDYVNAVSMPIDAPHLIELHTDRAEIVAHHETIREAVSSAGGYCSA
jgi:2-succinyl-5-enolpyruvyl-6-hydroxy-3-cyclohexene-1-carboxylate synthase